MDEDPHTAVSIRNHRILMCSSILFKKPLCWRRNSIHHWIHTPVPISVYTGVVYRFPLPRRRNSIHHWIYTRVSISVYPGVVYRFPPPKTIYGSLPFVLLPGFRPQQLGLQREHTLKTYVFICKITMIVPNPMFS